MPVRSKPESTTAHPATVSWEGGGGCLQNNSKCPSAMLISPILFQLFLQEIMQETHHDHHTSISSKKFKKTWASYVSPMTSILRAAAAANSKTPHQQIRKQSKGSVSYTHLTLPTTAEV